MAVSEVWIWSCDGCYSATSQQPHGSYPETWTHHKHKDYCADCAENLEQLVEIEVRNITVDGIDVAYIPGQENLTDEQVAEVVRLHHRDEYKEQHMVEPSYHPIDPKEGR